MTSLIKTFRLYFLLFTFSTLFCIQAESQSILPDSNSAIIYIYRPKSFLGSGSNVRVYFNGFEIEKMGNGTKFISKMYSEGIVEFQVSSKNPRAKHTLALKIENGKSYHLKISWPYRSAVRIEEEKEGVGVLEFRNSALFKSGYKEELIVEDRNNPIPITLKEFAEEEDPDRAESKKILFSGSGLCISQEGHIVTNYHVIKESEYIYVKGINGDFSKKYKVKVEVKDELNDLAILKIIPDEDKIDIDSIPFSVKTNLADVGENIYVLGYPLVTTMGDEIKLTNGIVSSKTGYKGNISLYQITAPVQPGNSGGPLFDSKGNLIGVVSAKHMDAENVSYAIKSNYIVNLINLLPKSINIENTNVLNGKSLPEQVKLVKNFVVFIEVH